jgi:hypothetical protein
MTYPNVTDSHGFPVFSSGRYLVCAAESHYNGYDVCGDHAGELSYSVFESKGCFVFNHDPETACDFCHQ